MHKSIPLGTLEAHMLDAALNDILEEAGIPQDHPTRVLTRHDTHNVIGPVNRWDIHLRHTNEPQTVYVSAGDPQFCPGGSIDNLFKEIKSYFKQSTGDLRKGTFGYSGYVDQEGNVIFHGNQTQNEREQS